MKKLKLILILGLALSSLKSFAYDPEAHFRGLVEEVFMLCEDSPCKGNVQVTEYSLDQKNLDQESQLAALKKLAVQLANVWFDTVYEGDYQPVGNTKLYSVIEYKQNNQLLFYYISYSKATYSVSGNCQYYEKSKRYRGSDCVYGVVSEKAVISPDLSINFVRSEDLADFSN